MVMAESIREDFGMLAVPVERQSEPFLKPHPRLPARESVKFR